MDTTVDTLSASKCAGVRGKAWLLAVSFVFTGPAAIAGMGVTAVTSTIEIE